MYQIYFILEWHSTCFGRSFRPSSGVQDCTYSNTHMSNRYCCLLASGYEMEPSEICRVCLFLAQQPPKWAMASSFTRFLHHTQRRTTVGRTPLDEWSARRRDLYLTTHKSHNRKASMSPVGFEPTISAGERPQTYALDRAATGTGETYSVILK